MGERMRMREMMLVEMIIEFKLIFQHSVEFCTWKIPTGNGVGARNHCNNVDH